MTHESLKAWRERMHWTKAEASRQLGLSPNGYAAYEKGDWRIKNWLALACAAIAHGLPPIK